LQSLSGFAHEGYYVKERITMPNAKSFIVLGASSLSFGAALIFGAGIASAQLDADVDAAGQAAGGGIGAAAGSVTGGLDSTARPGRDIGDAQIGVQVQSTISHELHAPGVRSDVRNGVATLNGTVATEADKQRAEQIARRVEGVTRVRNDLVVEHPGAANASVGQHLEQQAHAVGPSTETAISSRLRADARLAQRDIEVRTRNDVVTLTGDVTSVAEKETAGRIAAEAAGGAEVRNRLVVRSKD
jgi:osmotically-inducible protein OsmY